MGFSVLMSVYQKEKAQYLNRAVESVFEQTLLPDEVVLIEDGPLTEELENVIADLKKKYPNLVTFRFEKNVKLGRALAKGVMLCKNELIARMDTDDIAVKERFELQYCYMTKHKETAVCGGWLQEFNDEGTHVKVKKMPKTNEQIKNYAKYRNPLNHMTVMFRRSAVLAAGNYEHFPLLEDYELWNRMIAAGNQMYNLPQTLVLMRTNDSMYERRGGFAYFRQYEKLRRKQKQLGLLNWAEYAKAAFLTAAVTLLPSFLRKWLYHKFLREKK